MKRKRRKAQGNIYYYTVLNMYTIFPSIYPFFEFDFEPIPKPIFVPCP